MDAYERYSRVNRKGQQLNINKHRNVASAASLSGIDAVESPVRSISSDEEVKGQSDNDDSSESYSHSRRKPHRSRQPIRTIDWRAEICQAFKLDLSSKDSVLLENLNSAAERLEAAERLAAQALESRDPFFRFIHRVNCASENKTYLFLGDPYVVNSGPFGVHLRGSDEIHNYELFLEQNKALSFIGYKDYKCCDRGGRQHHGRSLDIEIETLLFSESVSIISPEFCSVLKMLAKEALVGIPHPTFEIEVEFKSPYLWWFHGRNKIEVFDRLLDEYHQQHVTLFKGYIQQRLGTTWAVVDNLLSKSMISAQFLPYLFVPNSILVAQSESGHIGQNLAYLADSWLNTEFMAGRRQFEFSGVIDAVSWAFDGNFQSKKTTLVINTLPSMVEPFHIQDLMIYPIEYAEKGVVDVLRARGEMFWKCRYRNYVCYAGQNDGISSNSDLRFMIDIATYKQMHEQESKKGPQRSNQDELGPEVMSRDDPPSNPAFILCLPKMIPGFDMNKKEWTNLDVSRLAPVRWNTKAFESLVVDKETKELISALVTNQIDAEKSTDLMSGKGNGLFILLHGGPGTGKTLTAESVAEFSKKPLYRVTCGDVGTKAEDVEKYLDAVMFLGKTWGCVVLLDEADVFLEQRRIFDLQRNALVSVFLRVLEYYDGILILTSNRVGIFDEAFKSRIQLTLRYKTLGAEARLKIWRNFIDRLEGFQQSTSTPKQPVISTPHGGVDLGIKAKEVREKLEQLAETPLNGREIRNAISTARQLAMFRKEQMGYEHLRVVIEEAKKFDKYLLELNQGLTRDQIMQDRGERLEMDE